jgi:hypothetical protein
VKKIEIWIPTDGPRTTILFGRELRYFTKDNFLYEKIVSCNLCGECCMDNPPTPYGHTEDGWCTKLEKMGDEYECTAGSMVPWNCVNQDPPPFDKCCIRYKKREL